MNQIFAPFSPEQVVALWRWQRRDDVHPFTCPDRGNEDHLGEGRLLPTVRGWICPFCDYTQNWAHDFMVKK